MSDFPDQDLESLISERTERALKLIQEEGKIGKEKISNVSETFKRRKEIQAAWRKRCQQQETGCCSTVTNELSEGGINQSADCCKDNTVQKSTPSLVSCVSGFSEVTPAEVSEYITGELEYIKKKAQEDLAALETAVREKLMEVTKET